MPTEIRVSAGVQETLAVLHDRRDRLDGAVAWDARAVASAAYLGALAADTGLPADLPQARTVAAQALADGVLVRLPAGRAAVLTVTGLEGWHHDHLGLVVEVPSDRVALPLTGEDRPRAGPPPFVVAGRSLAWMERVCAFAAPLYLRRVVVEATTPVMVALESPDHGPYGLERAAPPAPRIGTIEAAVSQLTLMWSAGQTAPRAAAILSNAPANLLLADGADRPLHRVAGTLRHGDVAQTPDLSAGVRGDRMVVRLTSQTEGVVRLRARWRRHRRAEGWQRVDAAAPEAGPLRVGVWDAPVVRPDAPPAAVGQVRTQLTAGLRADGPVRAGLCPPADPGAAMPLALAPRRVLAQPFRLAAAPAREGVRIAGVWLLLADRPAAPTALTLGLGRFDAAGGPGAPSLAEARVTLPPEAAGYEAVAGGGLAFWAAFDRPVPIDGPDLHRDHAVLVSGRDGPARLLEVALPQGGALGAACDGALGGPPVWRRRRFGAAAKALLCDLGLEATESAPGRLEIAGQAVTLAPGVSRLALEVAQAPLPIRSSRAVALTELQAVSRGPTDSRGPSVG